MRRVLFALALVLSPALATAVDLAADSGETVPFKEDSGASAGFTLVVVVLGVVAVGAAYIGNRRRQTAAPNGIAVIASRRIGMRSGLLLVRVRDKEILLSHANDRLEVVERWTVESKKETV